MHSKTTRCPHSILCFFTQEEIVTWLFCPHLAQPLRGEHLLFLVGVEEGEGLPQALDVLHCNLPVQAGSLAVASVHVMTPVMTSVMTSVEAVTPGIAWDVSMGLSDAWL